MEKMCSWVQVDLGFSQARKGGEEGTKDYR